MNRLIRCWPKGNKTWNYAHINHGDLAQINEYQPVPDLGIYARVITKDLGIFGVWLPHGNFTEIPEEDQEAAQLIFELQLENYNQGK